VLTPRRRRLAMLGWTSSAAWAVTLGAAYLALGESTVGWRVIVLIASSIAVNSSLAWLLLRELPPIATVYQVARSAPCDHIPPMVGPLPPNVTRLSVARDS
jgi:hypothetical protein